MEKNNTESKKVPSRSERMTKRKRRDVGYEGYERRQEDFVVVGDESRCRTLEGRH